MNTISSISIVRLLQLTSFPGTTYIFAKASNLDLVEIVIFSPKICRTFRRKTGRTLAEAKYKQIFVKLRLASPVSQKAPGRSKTYVLFKGTIPSIFLAFDDFENKLFLLGVGDKVSHFL